MCRRPQSTQFLFYLSFSHYFAERLYQTSAVIVAEVLLLSFAGGRPGRPATGTEGPVGDLWAAQGSPLHMGHDAQRQRHLERPLQAPLPFRPGVHQGCQAGRHEAGFLRLGGAGEAQATPVLPQRPLGPPLPHQAHLSSVVALL